MALHFGRCLRPGSSAHTAQALTTWPVSAATPNAEIMALPDQHLVYPSPIKTKPQPNDCTVMKDPKPKRKRTTVKTPPLNDGTNTPVPSPGIPPKLAEGEADLYKQAENPLGDPHRI